MSRPRIPYFCLITALLSTTALHAADEGKSWADELRLEAHGFASFGYLQTGSNNWLGQTEEGTNEFWEAAANVIARPMDHVRIGAQLFARDLVKYDNGKVSLDWAYVDYRAADEIGIQVGRIKSPLGLHYEALDIDSARASVFLPLSVYALRSRDLYISTDGAKAYGFLHIGSAGSLEYAGFGGKKEFSNDAGFATFMSELGVGDKINDISIDWQIGGFLHWHTPLEGLGLRVSGSYIDDFTVDALYTSSGFNSYTRADYFSGYLSAIYDMSKISFSAEYLRIRGRGEVSVPAAALVVPLADNYEGAYINATWHAAKWIDCLAGLEGAWIDAYDRDGTRAYSWVAAVNIMPLSNWSLKAEFRDIYGKLGVHSVDNPGGVSDHWQIMALKTTVDF
jgi:hypothetical protein